MSETEERRFTKHVAIKEVDEDERTATGAVLVPNEIDRQGDFLSSAGVAAMFNPATEDGLMHARNEAEGAETTVSELVDEPVALGDEEYPSGTWVMTRRYDDDDLWALVRDGVLGGFSIGGEVSDDERYSSVDELPDDVSYESVDVDKFDEFVEITNGFTNEVSDVDIPAVPRAVYSTAKSLEKNIVDNIDSRDEFVDVFEDRGQTAEDAGRLYDVLESFEARGVGKAEALAKLNITGTPTRGIESYEMTNKNTKDAGVGDLDDDDVGFLKWLREKVAGGDEDVEKVAADLVEEYDVETKTFVKTVDVLKEGRPLNQSNRTALMAAHDAIEATLESDLDDKTFETNRFTDDARYDFDLSGYEDKSASADVEKLTQDQGELLIHAIDEFVDSQGVATFGEFKEWTWNSYDRLGDDVLFATEQALDEYRKWSQTQRANAAITDEFGSWLENEANTDITMANSLNEKLDELEEKLDKYEKRIDELDGDVDKNTGDGDGDDDDDDDDKNAGDGLDGDAAEKLESIVDKVDGLDERVDKLSNATAETQQLGKASVESEKEPSEKRKTVWTR